MSDHLTKEQRSQLMSRIRGDDLGPESRLKAALAERWPDWESWCRFNPKDLPGKPDVMVGALAVFVHGCFWHQCPLHGKVPKSGRDGWVAKFRANRLRDARVRRHLSSLGYATKVVWEHDLKDNEQAEAVADRLVRFARKKGLIENGKRHSK